jgi:hypothetical protein
MNMGAQPRPHCGEFFPSMPLSLTERDIEAWYFASSPIAQTKLHPQPAEVSDRPSGGLPPSGPLPMPPSRPKRVARCGDSRTSPMMTRLSLLSGE